MFRILSREEILEGQTGTLGWNTMLYQGFAARRRSILWHKRVLNMGAFIKTPLSTVGSTKPPPPQKCVVSARRGGKVCSALVLPINAVDPDPHDWQCRRNKETWYLTIQRARQTKERLVV